MLVLGIETSCDETAAAVLQDGQHVLSNIIASQHNVHAPYGGVVPELACRSHIENIRPVIETALRDAGITFADLDALAVTRGPGLVGALLVGISLAKSLAYSLEKPLIPVHHLEGHIHSIYLEHPDLPMPCITLVVSGGHSDLYYCPQRGCYTVLGRTRDDAAGECFDKVAKMLHLGYPGGPIIDRLARQGNPQAVHFPRALPAKENYDFSFSGVKTAVRTHLLRLSDDFGQPLFPDDTFWPLPTLPEWQNLRNDILASFQSAVVDALVGKTRRAVEYTRARAITMVGGVACNAALRQQMRCAGEELGIPVFFPAPIFCTDNAAMIACAGTYRYQQNPAAYTADTVFELDAHPNLQLTNVVETSARLLMSS